MLRSIEGEVAWVTGAGTGIGQAGAIAQQSRADVDAVGRAAVDIDHHRGSHAASPRQASRMRGSSTRQACSGVQPSVDRRRSATSA